VCVTPKKEMDEIKKLLDSLSEEINAMKELHKQPRESSMTEDIGEISHSTSYQVQPSATKTTPTFLLL